MIEIFNVAVAVIVVIGLIWVFTDDDGIIGILARIGVGGYYQYWWNRADPDSPPRITGPYNRRISAEGPTWNARHYSLIWIEVKYHLRPPNGAIAPFNYET